MILLWQKSKILATISIMAATLVIAILANWFQSAAEDAVLNSTVREMEEIVRLQEFALENAIEECEDDLSLLADYIVNNNIPVENIIDYLNSQSQVEEFDNLYYINLDGKGFSKFGEISDFSQNHAFLQALENKYFISIPTISAEKDEFLFNVAVPVLKNGKVEGVLYSENAINDFFTSYYKTLEDRSDVFIVNHDLDFVFSTSQGHIGEASIPEGDIQEMGIENVIQAQASIKSGNNGSFSYNYYGIPKIMVYMPIAMTNWALAINVETDAINSELARAVNQLRFICQAIYWFLIILIIYTSLAQHRSLKLLEKTAYHDSLTGLANSNKLKKEMQTVLQKDSNTLYSIIVFDIENFKAFNQLYSYEMGNNVLKTMKLFADTLTEPSLCFARIDGDKFAMFAKSEFLNNIENLIYEGESFYDELIPELIEHEAKFKFGRYSIERGETDVDDIMNKVNLAHKKAREIAGQLLCDYDDYFQKQVLFEANITNKMKPALKNKEFAVYLQPKFSVENPTLVGAESLVRWIEADGKMIYPNEFIPVFEKNGFIVELDRYILEHTCIALRNWIDAGIGCLPISVNCSRLNINSSTFIEDTLAIVDKYSIPHELIELEITESTTIEDEGMLKVLFSQLQELGFKVSIDDFGSGYSSLSMLKNLNVNTLKMDKSFFPSDCNERSILLIDGVIKLTQSLGIYVVAEGIEEEKQLELLKNVKCDAVQGYYYSKPISIADFEQKYGSNFPRKAINGNI